MRFSTEAIVDFRTPFDVRIHIRRPQALLIAKQVPHCCGSMNFCKLVLPQRREFLEH